MDATEAALVTAIEDDPDDVENFRVYADYLDGNSDPRGRLISMMIMLERITEGGKRMHLLKRLVAHFEEHRDAFLPSSMDRISIDLLLSSKHHEYMQWRWGYLRHLTVPEYEESMERLEELLAHP